MSEGQDIVANGAAAKALSRWGPNGALMAAVLGMFALGGYFGLTILRDHLRDVAVADKLKAQAIADLARSVGDHTRVAGEQAKAISTLQAENTAGREAAVQRILSECARRRHQ